MFLTGKIAWHRAISVVMAWLSVVLLLGLGSYASADGSSARGALAAACPASEGKDAPVDTNLPSPLDRSITSSEEGSEAAASEAPALGGAEVASMGDGESNDRDEDPDEEALSPYPSASHSWTWTGNSWRKTRHRAPKAPDPQKHERPPGAQPREGPPSQLTA